MGRSPEAEQDPAGIAGSGHPRLLGQGKEWLLAPRRQECRDGQRPPSETQPAPGGTHRWGGGVKTRPSLSPFSDCLQDPTLAKPHQEMRGPQALWAPSRPACLLGPRARWRHVVGGAGGRGTW